MLRLHSIIRKKYICNHHKLFSTTPVVTKKYCCKLLVVGGGSGGCAVAAKFAKIFCKHEIIIVEPSQVHYYQPFFTLVGAGVKKIRDCIKTTIEVLPQEATWLKDSVLHFCPCSNTVITKKDDIIEYDFMVIAIGVNVDYDRVTGLTEALQNYRNVATIYDPRYAEKTFKCLREFVEGMALFTASKTPIKCLAAAYKICFLAQDYFKMQDKLCGTDVTFASGTNSFMPVEKYDKFMWNVAKRKKIDVHFRTNLVEVIPESRKAVFECLKKPGNKITFEYSMLHVTPPMSPPEALTSCKELINDHKYADVDQNTLQHKKYPNVFAIGDCTPCTFNKTLSAVALQTSVIFKNLLSVYCGKVPVASYDGHTACPVVTGYGTCLLAEYNYALEVCETLPYKQDVESRITYFVVREIMPRVYWRYILNGTFHATENMKKIFPLRSHLTKKK